MKVIDFLVQSLILGLIVITCGTALPVAAQLLGEPELLVMPEVDVPAEAKVTGLGGIVLVRVTVSKDGSVTAVEAVDGPDAVCRSITRPDVLALREAARAAAMSARFKPDSENEKHRFSSAVLSFRFPSSKAKGTPIYSAAAADGTQKPPPEPDKPVTSAETRYTIIGDLVTGGPSVKTGALVTDINQEPGVASGGVLNGKATYLAKPPYPPAARAVRAAGAVSIKVLIETTGGVFAAQALSGHPLLRAASVLAACESKFTPPELEGRPVRLSGIIVYNFVP